MNRKEIIEKEAKYLVNTYKRPDVVFVRGEGPYLFDSEGGRYLDFASGICVNALGHSDSEWVEGVCAQLKKLVHVSNLYHTGENVELAEFLVNQSFADRVYFSNSGAEANEAALKFSKKWARKNDSPDKVNVVSFEGGFHGRTAGALSLTHKHNYRSPFEPLVPGVRFAPFNDIDAAKELIDDKTCAVFVEPVQGEGGIHEADKGFLTELKKICREHSAVLVFDEIQCGLGRTGSLWAYERYGVTPDIMTLAKPLAGGLPIGATLVTDDVARVIEPGDHGSTFAGGPLVCRAALIVLERLAKKGFMENVRKRSVQLMEGIKSLGSSVVKEVRGAGLLVGVEMDMDDVAPIIDSCREKGLLIIKAGPTVLRLTPPLTVEEQHVKEALKILADSLKKETKLN